MARLQSILQNLPPIKMLTCVICLAYVIIFIVVGYFSFIDQASNMLKNSTTDDNQKTAEHTLCVVVPFRDTFDELLQFVPHTNAFLNRQSIEHRFIIVNHVHDGNRFNRGVIFNAGYRIISEQYPDCDYLALHDIDLLPLNDALSYKYPGNDVYHVASPDYHPLGEYYDPENYVGGIVIISNEQYARLNGFGNNFWGWGGEDRNFYYRMSNNSVLRIRPLNLATNRTNTFKNIHSPRRRRDHVKYGKENRTMLIEHDFETGLHDVKYELISVSSINIDNVPLSLFSISIPCNYTKTPWCKSSSSNDTTDDLDARPDWP